MAPHRSFVHALSPCTLSEAQRPSPFGGLRRLRTSGHKMPPTMLSLSKHRLRASGDHEQRSQLKLRTSEEMSKCQPSARRKTPIFKGKAIMVGGTIIMPRDIKTAETNKSISSSGT